MFSQLVKLMLIPHEELKFYQRDGAKRKKALPPNLSPNDQKVLKSVRRRAYHLDLALSLCGFRIGWAGIIGLIPWIGDFIAAYLALLLLKKAKEIDGGLPSYLETQMSGNIAFDFGIGLIPIVGDIVNIAYKANSRNCLILEAYLRQKYSTDHTTKKHHGWFGHKNKDQNGNDETLKPATAGYNEPQLQQTNPQQQQQTRTNTHDIRAPPPTAHGGNNSPAPPPRSNVPHETV
ncbi:putative membrane protein [Wickerhamomyces ciferrii]|uniref:Membrane protein n=1 Tax=Wickerhamomyces ciferrii (strain ATCC 14091 / BCRC 22168 / CBS 111 / JCM 3599 / NBRC 0793 / NRRL Y-1031 F-60-10) TaxID=1206466 RepID=K0KNI4_WICCF|nr:uncharacterized protein BN7_6394 [Wickerhamomyces ciferrii]CCH46795.1 putative membrane protein [Wickerhamomyces ciferrii]